jgi:hypothetical protein
MNQETERKEPDDTHYYSTVMFRVETLQAYMMALRPYLEKLKDRVEGIRMGLGDFVPDEALKALPEAREVVRVERVINYLQKHIDEADGGGSNPHALAFMEISHGTVRLIKGAVLDRVNDLRLRRDALARGGGTPVAALTAADLEIARIESQVSTGVFAQASPASLLKRPDEETARPEPLRGDVGDDEQMAAAGTDRGLSIHILDEQLSDRCLDLLLKFVAEGRADRFDTVLQEAGRILEVRLREAAGAAQDLAGVELAKFALGGPNPPLVLSTVPAEQEAAHLFFRGVFGFLRNPTHHRFLGQLALERVMQHLGLIDYLLGLLDGARREVTPAGG